MTRPLDVAAAAILFDMDGTLVDSTAVVEAMWTQLALDHGLDTAAVIAFAHGRPTRDTLAHFLPSLSASRRDTLERAFTDEEVRRTEGVVEVPGAAALLDRLLTLAAPVAVVTSAGPELATSRMSAAGVPIPEVLVTPDDIAHGKPAPDGYLLAAELVGAPIEACLVFEDAEAGLVAACASGARVVVVGEHRSATTDGLDRVADLTRVSVERDGLGLRVCGPPPPG